jgi:MoxR-like ATPase
MALYKTGQAMAALRGRDYVIPDDLKALAPLVLTHRLIVRPGSQLRGRTTPAIVDEILEQAELHIGELS